MSGFSDPVIAGEVLIRDAIQSPGYIEHATGWSINADGTADFADVDIRGSLTAGGSWAITASGLTVPAGTPSSSLDYGNAISQMRWTDTGTPPVAGYIQASTDGEVRVRARSTIRLSAPDGVTVPDGSLVTDSLSAAVPAIRLERRAAQSITNNSVTVIAWDYVPYRGAVTNGPTNDGTSITITESGIYLLTAGTSFDSNATGTRALWIDDGSRRVVESEAKSDSGTYTALNVSTAHYIPAATTISAHCYQNSGGALNIGGGNSYSFFTAALLSRALEVNTAPTDPPPPPPPPPPTTGTYEFLSNGSGSWTSNGGGYWRTDNDMVYQGNGSYWGGQGGWHGYFFYPDGAFSRLTGKTITGVRVWLYRHSGSGDNTYDAVTVWEHRLAWLGGSGTPDLAIESVDAGAFGWNDGHWVPLDVSVGEHLRDGYTGIRGVGLCRINQGDSPYAIFDGNSISNWNGKLSIDWSA